MQNIRGILAPLSWCMLILAGFLIHGASGHDDPHINFWFSHTLLEQGQLVNYNGDRVEQTTSLLLVLMTALSGLLLPFDLVTCGYLVDVISAFGCCWLITVLAKRFCPVVSVWPAILMLMSNSFMLWTFGGMGAVLAAFVVLCGAAVWWSYVESPRLGVRQYASLAGVTFALVLVRPEMPLIILACAISLLVLHANDKKRRIRFLHIFLISLSGFLLLLAWQKFYFSSWLPLPVMAKQAGDRSLLSKLDVGFVYLTFSSIFNPVTLVLALSTPFVFWNFYKQSMGMPAGDFSPTIVTALLILVLFSGAYCGFAWASGGDWMQGGRFLVPVIPVSSLLVFTVAALLVRRKAILNLFFLLLVFFGLCLLPGFVVRESHGVPVWAQYRLKPADNRYSIFEKYNQEHLRDMAVISHLRNMIPPLYQQLGRPVRLLSGQAGMVFYTLGKEFYGQVQFSDFRGLVEGGYTTCPLLENIHRNAMGLDWNYIQLFEMQPALQSVCNVQQPDIIYDVNHTFYDVPAVFDQAGYALIHQERGFVLVNKSALGANRLLTPNLIFVRKDLLPLLVGKDGITLINYDDVPLKYRAENIWH
jgi:hypothetical protein